jgi:hypothetical protein
LNCFSFLHEIICTNYFTPFKYISIILAATDSYYSDALLNQYCSENWEDQYNAGSVTNTIDQVSFDIILESSSEPAKTILVDLSSFCPACPPSGSKKIQTGFGSRKLSKTLRGI